MEIITLSLNTKIPLIISTIPWMALSLALLAIGYCIGLSFGSINSLDVLKLCITNPDISACIEKVEKKIFWPDAALVISLIGLLFGAFAVLIACAGLSTWKNELKHKRNLDLFDFLTENIGKISLELGLLGNVVRLARIEYSMGGATSNSRVTNSTININYAISGISKRIQNEVIVNTKLLAEFRNLEKELRGLTLFLNSLCLEPKLSPLDRDGNMKLQEKEEELIRTATEQLDLFKRLCRENLTAG